MRAVKSKLKSFAFDYEIDGKNRRYELFPAFPIDRLKYADPNPRDNEAAIDPVAKSIAQFGFNSIPVAGPDFRVCAGHTRVKSAIQLGKTEIPLLVSYSLTGNDFKGYNIAAEKLNRKCYAMEIDPVYCDVAMKRWEQFTGKKAERITNDATTKNKTQARKAS